MIKDYTLEWKYLPCHIGTQLLVAKIKADQDLSELLPYLNAVAEKARYQPKFNWLRFIFRGYPHKRAAKWTVAVQGNEISVRRFKDKEQVKEICAELIKYLNDIEQKKETITPSYKEWEQPQAIEIYKHLPKTNCRKCGEPTCMSFAVKLALEEVELDDCVELDKDSEAYCQIREMIE
ncbi:MAG: Fe-S cluster domain protein [Thermoanaerobacterales bacterium 50_218]|jgi:ArsR family metal-binding transcriptional regulator|nr:MAG: Fe-S cluster domain protein [Thermoanaerobacterales bacterium 50_218]HAA89658.1 hypothetical protein [Peptococcaceae bacterium]